MNAILGHFAQSNPRVATFGDNRHYSIERQTRAELKGGLEVLRRFYKSVRTGTGRLLLNVNVSYGVFFEPGPLHLCYRKIGIGNKSTLGTKLKGLRVEITHLSGNKSKKTGQLVKRIKSVYALTRPGDGSGDPYPPKLELLEQGPKSVQFYIEGPSYQSQPDTQAKPTKESGGATMPVNAYISVFKYFSIRKSENRPKSLSLLTYV